MTDVLDVLDRAALQADDERTFSAVALERAAVSDWVLDATPVIRPLRRHAGGRYVFVTRREYWVDESPERHPATAALDDLRTWLNLPLDAIVALVGLTPSARQWWRDHPTSPVRPAKAGKVLRMRNAVGLLVGARGIEIARATLHAGGWMAEPLDDARLYALEALARSALGGGQELKLPPGVRTGPDANAAATDITVERERQTYERERSSWSLGPEEPA